MRILAILITLTAVCAWAGDWSEAVEVRQEVELCLQL
jgi:hypothetical protein